MNCDQALFEGKIQGVVATCYVDERPLRGLAGLLDWRFQGVISRCLKDGVISGKAGECAYVPVSRAGRTYHVILAGGGFLGTGQGEPQRTGLPPDSWKALAKNLASLKLTELGLSLGDFGAKNEAELRKHLPGIDIQVLE